MGAVVEKREREGERSVKGREKKETGHRLREGAFVICKNHPSFTSLFLCCCLFVWAIE